MEQTSKTSVLIFSVFALTRWTGGRLFLKPPAPGPQTGAARTGRSKNLRGKHPVKQNAIRMQGRAEAARSRTQFCRTACSRRAEQPAPPKDGRAANHLNGKTSADRQAD
ncbi:hypothetical protein AB3466_01430 [Sphingobacterium thalpophilum]|uniref:hypothetical protein n=1 Tax=Sphingobacterium thalpophilum TaxID=259 RepID=UPI0031D9D7FE